MEWIIIAVVIFAAFWIGSNKIIGAAKQQQEENADTLLDDWFDGRDQVFVEHGPSSMAETLLLEGANARGYRLVQPYPKQAYSKMLFEKRT
jgi:hypothetical protein